MSFEKAGNFLIKAAQKYNLHQQAGASLQLVKVRALISEYYPAFIHLWKPTKFEGGTLTIKATSPSASSELFMRTHEFMEKAESEGLPEVIKEVKIVRR